MKYYLPLHYNSGNRGCQGITEGSSLILNENKDNILCYSTDIELDKDLGLSNYVSLVQQSSSSLFDRTLCKLSMLFTCNDYSRRYIKDKFYYAPIYNKYISEGGIMLSTGGDMLCYSNNEVNTCVDFAKRMNSKIILWGCSMGQENLTVEKEIALRRFDLIYARESLSFKFFKELGLSNVVCLPDPAFVLHPAPIQLPRCFDEGEVVGLNISNYVLGGGNLDEGFGLQLIKMIDYILNNTDLRILLIPHVTWGKQDDRRISQLIKEHYFCNNKISVLNIDEMSYCQIRFVISNCRFFIGGRTHAVISAYSCCVPTLALGYSIKAKGIALDLGLCDKLVVDCKNQESVSLTESFQYLLENETLIRNCLSQIMPIYSRKPYDVMQFVNKI